MPPPTPLPIPVPPPSILNTLMEGYLDAGKDMSLINKRDQNIKGNLGIMKRGSYIYIWCDP